MNNKGYITLTFFILIIYLLVFKLMYEIEINYDQSFYLKSTFRINKNNLSNLKSEHKFSQISKTINNYTSINKKTIKNIKICREIFELGSTSGKMSRRTIDVLEYLREVKNNVSKLEASEPK